MLNTLKNSWNHLLATLFPGPLKAALRLGLIYIAISTLVRLAFFVWSIHSVSMKSGLAAMGVGLLFDIGVAVFFLAPFCVLILAWRQRSHASLRATLYILLIPVAGLIGFTAFAEFTFWNEFTSRFNFIAIDYLVYSREVIGNIRESYNMPVLFTLLGMVTAALWFVLYRAMRPSLTSPFQPISNRLARIVSWILIPLAAYFAMDVRFKNFSSNAIANEIAGNGYFDILHAFWFNEINYEKFYRTIPDAKAAILIAKATGSPPPSPGRPAFSRDIAGQNERRLNVVMVTIESFSASFMKTFGSKADLTPRMDQLASESMLFTQMYATGTRTVRGLEAVSVSIPPTPGNSIVKRPANGNLFTIGSVFRDKGYDRLYLYGGYSYFDNMEKFYSGNGYTVIDRLALDKSDIHHENIWGVADEDLFTLTLREMDKRHAAGKQVFAHVMTTSNHRPFTYPTGRIDIRPKSGRDGGVKYTDWAIGNFIDKAKEKPWFKDTIFVLVADHTHNGRGRRELPPENYHIPMLIYAPGLIKPQRIDTIASQIDIPPTILGILGFSYNSRFFGKDILKTSPAGARAFMSNNQTVGYYKNGKIVELRPKGEVRVVDAASSKFLPADGENAALVDEAIAYYQSASKAFDNGKLRLK